MPTAPLALRALLFGLSFGLSLLASPGASAQSGKVLLTGGLGGIDGAALGWHNRFGISLARQDFDADDERAPVGPAGLRLKLDIAGLKLIMAADAALGSDRWLPQVAVGVLHKRVGAGASGPTPFGPRGADPRGDGFYLSATQLLLAPSVLLNGTLRITKVDPNGPPGFAGARHWRLTVDPELSVAWLMNRTLAVGLEARIQPQRLKPSVLGVGALQGEDWLDAFLAWAPSENLSLTLAWVDLGRRAPVVQPRRQRGVFLSAQVAY